MASPDPDISFDAQNDYQHHQPDNPHNEENQFDNESISSTSSTHELNTYENERDTSASHKNNDHPSQTLRMNQQNIVNTSNNCGDHFPSYMTQPSSVTQSIKPDSYDGSKSFEQYLSHFEDCSELARWDYRTRVLTLSASLRGSARTYYMTLSAEVRRDYQLLVSRLRDRFGHLKHQALWLNKLENRKRQRGESIATLGDDLIQLSQKAYSDLDCRAQEKLALNQFYRSLSTDMKCRCVDNNCSTVTEAVSVVEKYECILGSQSGTVRALESMPTNKSSEDLITVIKRLENKVEKKYDNKNRVHNEKSNHNCFGCNSPNHLWRCPKNARVNRNVNNIALQNERRTPSYDQRFQYLGNNQNQVQNTSKDMQNSSSQLSANQ
jgi:hypothetical protein